MAVTTAASLSTALEPSFPKLVPFRFKLQRRKSWHELPGFVAMPSKSMLTRLQWVTACGWLVLTLLD